MSPATRRARGLLAVLLGALAVVGAVPASAQAATPAATLDARVRAALRGSTARTVGSYVLVEGLGTVASINPRAPIPPASNEKMYGALAALVADNPGRRLRTEVRHTGVLADGVLDGDLVLVAAGDPTVKGADLDTLARAVASAGVRWVSGDLWVDDTRYDRVRRVSGWRPEDVPDEIGPLSAFVVDRNTWRKDAAYVADPVPYNLARLRSALQAAGVTLVGADRVGQPAVPLVDGPPLAVRDSPQIAWLVTKALKDSDNLYAELLLKELGAQHGQGSTAHGAAQVRALGSAWGLDLGGYVDGSGLSSLDRSTPLTAVSWLRRAQSTSVAPVFKQALAVGCRDGTLKARFCGTAASGRVSAKTGTIVGVRTLSGYTVTRSNRKVWFSFMLAGASSGTEARRAVDRAVVAIADFTG